MMDSPSLVVLNVMFVFLLNAVDQAFESLFYGTGSWLGILLIIILTLGIVLKWAYAGALVLPVIIWMSYDYYQKIQEGGGYHWHFIVLLVLATFIIFYMAEYNYKRR